ncbi:MAG: ExeM/NucH family extracellular endonuclease [Propionibacteriaceae bacterium]|nr:ExeM/NucH family extracellular endonuclease [Propionibacteriaceae bacterium]
MAEFGGSAPEQKLTQLTDVTLAEATGCAPVAATALATLPATDAEKEAYEGMLVHPQGTYTITNNYDLNRYGQLGLTSGDQPLYTATDVVAPGAAAEAYEAENQKKLITLDDGSSWDYQNNNTAKRSPLPYLSQETPRRTGSQLTFTQPVILDYRFQWNYQPTGQVVGHDDPNIPVTSENDREAQVPAVGGDLQIAAFNVLNYFTDLGMDEAGCQYYADMHGTPVTARNCQVRGAWTEEAFNDQKTKIVAAVNQMDAEIVALMEIENSAGITYINHARDYTLAQLVSELNAAGGDWAYAESPVVTPSNEDVIRTAFIYRKSAVQTLGRSEILLDDAFANARYPLAQKFKMRRAGKPFVLIANHFKSKGSGEDDGTGQGLANPSREAQARALATWSTREFQGEAVFLMGDFNAYAKETPIQIIEAAGYLNLAKAYEPESATYQFGGRVGSLDHVLANAKAQELVTGAAVWDINGDESIAMQYSRRKSNIVDFHDPGPFASSDHDPIVVGLGIGPSAKGKAR